MGTACVIAAMNFGALDAVVARAGAKALCGLTGGRGNNNERREALHREGVATVAYNDRCAEVVAAGALAPQSAAGRRVLV
jgi:hypothetical protein